MQHAISKINYSHQDMIDCLIVDPTMSQRELAARYGYTESWVSQVMGSDAWKAAFAARRAKIADPEVAEKVQQRFTIDEQFKGITLFSLQKLQERLERPACPDQVILKAVELGAKALGVGGNAPPPLPPADHLAQLANRLIDLQEKVTTGVTINGTSEVVPE